MINAALRKEMEEREQTRQQLLLRDTALQAAANAITIVDWRGRIIWANPAFAQLTGYRFDEIIGKNPRVLKSGRHDRQFYKKLWDTILAGEVWQGQLTNRRKDGSTYTEEMTITPMRGATDEITHFIAIKQDITERKCVEAELSAARDAALAAVRMKSQFLANMSHEIRTPMNGVIGMTEMLLDTKLGREQRDIVETIHHSGDLLLTIVNDILDFSKIDAGKLVFEKLDFDLRETVESTLELFAEKTQAKGLELVGQVEPGVFTHLRGDAGRLRQILANLLNNAIKFTESGEVVVTVRQAPDNGPASQPKAIAASSGGISPVTCSTPSGCARPVKEAETGKNPPKVLSDVHLRFEVRDTGIGIAPEFQQRLFEAFNQADNSTTRKYGGTGLGLTISQQLAAMMQGEIGVISEIHKGSTFWFTARFARQSTDQLRRDETGLAGLRALIVESNATNRKFLGAQLLNLGIPCTAVGSAHEALALLHRENTGPAPFVLAIFDMQLPDMDGITLAGAIKADPALNGIRLIMLTTLGHNPSPERAKAAGIGETIVKPIKYSRLYRCLSAAMNRREIHRALPASPPFSFTPAASPAHRSHLDRGGQSHQPEGCPAPTQKARLSR